ncbi:hypothetical protein [Foetidibacter luteolus]|uniref:hypothetical protein n=1 Tax=Foetidibacter luteolus TaxID=2608880 RepID=UPI00129A8F7A|nr:hypothetical protein [Foetidibacter luteolus]
MEQKNFEYLSNQLEKTGFGKTLDAGLKREMEKGAPEFELKLYSSYGSGRAVSEATLHFRKGAESERYFFNKYDMALKGPDNDTIRENTFYINKTNNITHKEAYNLLEGRAVNKDLTKKDGQKYNAWVELDLSTKDKYGNFGQKQYGERYGFDLEKELGKLPIKELENERSANYLINGLKKGNLTDVTLVTDGQEQRVLLDVSPKDRSVLVSKQEPEPLKGIIPGKQQTETFDKEKDAAKETKPDVVKEFFEKKENTRPRQMDKGMEQ